MCGIVAYLGFRPDVIDILVTGLERLEYRGYDSAGLAVVDSDNTIQVRKRVGKVAELKKLVTSSPVKGFVGIAHTRWATHGEPNDVNSHPHCSGDGQLAIVHNGIIENEHSLREQLLRKGYTFKSQTDTEVLVQLISDVVKTTGKSIEEAFPQALNAVTGAYGVVLMSAANPDVLLAAKMGSPLILAIADGEFFLGSDATPFLEYTKNVIYLNDGEWVVAKRNGEYHISTLRGVRVFPEVTKLEMDLESIEKGGYPHFMLKEIMEQPLSIANCLRGRLRSHVADGDCQIRLGGLASTFHETQILTCLRNAPRIVIVACGTSFHAGMVGRWLIEELVHVPVEVEYASEFRYRKPVLEDGVVVIAVSQSGETADTLAAVKIARERDLLCLGLVNVVGSSIARETHAGVYLHAGPEIGVASTKAFTAQVTVFAMLALAMAENHTLSRDQTSKYVEQLLQMPALIQNILQPLNDQIKAISQTFRYAQNFLYLGRAHQYAVALEGALKLKEISYIHAEGYPASELKHALIALVENNLPAVFIAMQSDTSFNKLTSNIREYVAHGGVAIGITDDVLSGGSNELDKMCEYVVRLPGTRDMSALLLPLVTVIPLQLLSYHVAVLRGCNVDKPRNLAKAVTVE
eukprot:c10163_g1_i1.p1 GENE.c10163_g1_i1~~c10163_g1_i1.p1  ORF type:complete len:634 (+),score=182.06 c10163_g1_i1:175-2076(+)